MAYGGGKWTPPVQNKIMPGTYISFSSKARPTNIFGERGYVAFGMKLSGVPENKIIEVTPADLQKNSQQLLNLEYTAPELLPLREALKYAKVAYVYNLKQGGKRAYKETKTGFIKLIAKNEGEAWNKMGIDLNQELFGNANDPRFIFHLNFEAERTRPETTFHSAVAVLDLGAMESVDFDTRSLHGEAKQRIEDFRDKYFPVRMRFEDLHEIYQGKELLEEKKRAKNDIINIVLDYYEDIFISGKSKEILIFDRAKMKAMLEERIKKQLQPSQTEENITIDQIKDGIFKEMKKEDFDFATDYLFQGGEDGKVTTKSHVDFLTALERKHINILCYAGYDPLIKDLYISYVNRRVNMEGAYFQLVIGSDYATRGISLKDPGFCVPVDYDSKNLYNSELVIEVLGQNYSDSRKKVKTGDIVYWAAGLEAGCEINETAGSKLYNGELKLDLNIRQRDLEKAVKRGLFMFHEVDTVPRVLMDINTYWDFSKYKNEDFKENQIIRVLHQIGNDWSVIFNRYYLDKVQNTLPNRLVLWDDFHNHALKMERMGAIQDLDEEDITVEEGDTKDSVYCLFNVRPVMAMRKLYLEVIVE